MTDDMDSVLAHLSSHGDFTAADISEALGLGPKQVHTALLALEAEDLVERRSASGSGPHTSGTEEFVLWGVKRIDPPPLRPIVKNLFRRITRRSA